MKSWSPLHRVFLLGGTVLGLGIVSAPASPQEENATTSTIVVIGNRAVVANLENVPVEAEYDPDRVASYGASTVGELVDAIASEDGDDGPTILVNGQPVRDAGDIADYPVEAIEKVQVLPRGSAARVGGSVGARAYNVVLRKAVRSLTVTAAQQEATEGDWSMTRGEGIATWIRGSDRINLSLRGSTSSLLRQSDRDVVPIASYRPFATLGNVVPYARSSVDPVLDAIAGTPVTSVALPQGAAHPTLAQVAAGANQLNSTDVSDFRTLRGRNEPVDLSLAGSTKLQPWLTLNVNGRLNWLDTLSLNGLPTGSFLIPAGGSSPFSVPVTLLLNDPGRPLMSRSSSRGATVSTTLTAMASKWRLTTFGRYDRRARTSAFDLVAPVNSGFVPYDAALNPFGGELAALIPVATRVSRSRTQIREASQEAEGPLLSFPAGDIRLQAKVGYSLSTLNATDAAGLKQSFRRHETTAKAGLSIPLTGPSGGDGSMAGTSDLSLEAGVLDLGRYGTIGHYGVGLNWQALDWMRISASVDRDGTPVYPELLASPTVIEQNSPYFDPLRNETAYVTSIYGGAGNLANEKQTVSRIGLNFSPWERYKARISTTFTQTLTRDLIGSLPPPSAAVAAAFPDRFLRDAAGILIQVDNRTVNFDRQKVRDLRTNLDFTVPLTGGKSVPTANGAKSAPSGQWQLIGHASHTWLISADTVIRKGLPTIDLLDGGAIGIGGGGRQRHMLDASLALMRGVDGFRIGANWRGASYLQIGTLAVPDRLAYEPYGKIDARAFFDLAHLAPESWLLKNAKVTFAVDNLTNSRQGARTGSGVLPLYYQRAFRDPVGRTVSVELRKVF